VHARYRRRWLRHACCVKALVDQASGTLRAEGFGRLVVKTIRYPFKPFLMPRASRALRAGADEHPEVEGLVGLVKSFNYAGITAPAWQKTSEITALLRLLQAEPPQTVLEIGTAGGGTLFLLARVAAADALLVSVDLRHGRFGGGYPAWRGRFYRSFAREDQRVEPLRGNSHDQRLKMRVERLLDGRALDFLFIDGDHAYDGVQQDFADYSPLVPPGGLIAFHDIVPGGFGKHGDPGGVPTFWRELRASRPDVIELVEDWEWGSCGIGVLRKTPD
jgi:predicted O-methyltransferase YrrM